MIPARKGPVFAWWFARDCEGRLRRAFGALRVRGLDELRAHLREGPVLIVSNHTAWWDPIVLVALCVRVLRADAYALMDAQNLRRLPFFAKVGAFGVDLEDPADGLRGVRYAARLLDRPGRLVWVFPQGREVPLTARALEFRAGAAAIARLAPRARVIPAALRYELGSAPEPDVLVSFGEPLDPPARRPRDLGAEAAAQARAVAAELRRLDDALAEGDLSVLTPVFARRLSRGFALAQTVLAWLTRA